MDDAELNLGMRKNRLDNLRKTLQTVNTGNEDILDGYSGESGPPVGAKRRWCLFVN